MTTQVNGPDYLDSDERSHLLRMACRAPKVLPGPVGEMVERELLTWYDFGFRFGGSGIVMRLIADIEKREIPSAKTEE